MPLLPNQNPAAPLWKRRAFVGAIGAAAISLANLAAYVWGWGPQVTVLVNAAVGSVLAIWQSLTTSAPTGGVEDDAPTWTPPPSGGPSPRSVLVGAGVALLVFAAAPTACTARHVSPDTLPPPVQIDPAQHCTVQVQTVTHTINVDLVGVAGTVVRELASVIDRALGGNTPPIVLSLAAGSAKWATAEGLCKAFEAIRDEVGSGDIEVRVFR